MSKKHDELCAFFFSTPLPHDTGTVEMSIGSTKLGVPTFRVQEDGASRVLMSYRTPIARLWRLDDTRWLYWLHSQRFSMTTERIRIPLTQALTRFVTRMGDGAAISAPVLRGDRFTIGWAYDAPGFKLRTVLYHEDPQTAEACQVLMDQIESGALTPDCGAAPGFKREGRRSPFPMGTLNPTTPKVWKGPAR
jgi:hypothetical protein